MGPGERKSADSILNTLRAEKERNSVLMASLCVTTGSLSLHSTRFMVLVPQHKRLLNIFKTKSVISFLPRNALTIVP